jgi:hypothetical protein
MFQSNQNKIISNACFDIDEQNMLASSKFWVEVAFIAYCYISARPSINSDNHHIFAWHLKKIKSK